MIFSVYKRNYDVQTLHQFWNCSYSDADLLVLVDENFLD